MIPSKDVAFYIAAMARPIPEELRDEFFGRVCELLRGTPAEYADARGACLDARDYVLKGAK